MKTNSIGIASGHAGSTHNRSFNKTYGPLLYIIYLLAILYPLSGAEASPEADFTNWMAKASAGDAASQQKVGQAYYEGRGVQQNHKEAFAWLLKAAAQNDIQAQKDVAYLYSNGHGVSPDETAAFNWHMKAAQLGDPMAMLVVATRYEMGIGVAADNVKSTHWLQRSALHGNNEAKSALAYAYLTGNGVPKDPEQALALFLDSAELAPSRFYISYFYAHGVVVTKDKAKAYMWCLLATEIAGNNTQYVEELAKLKSGLTSTRITQATKAAAEHNQFMVDRNMQRRGLTLAYFNKKNARLPFRLESGAIIVPLQVSGLGEVNFLVDTGAQFSALAQRVADKIKLKSNDYIEPVPRFPIFKT